MCGSLVGIFWPQHHVDVDMARIRHRNVYVFGEDVARMSCWYILVSFHGAYWVHCPNSKRIVRSTGIVTYHVLIRIILTYLQLVHAIATSDGEVPVWQLPKTKSCSSNMAPVGRQIRCIGDTSLIMQYYGQLEVNTLLPLYPCRSCTMAIPVSIYITTCPILRPVPT